MSYEIRRLAQELARQGRIVDDLATKPQLAYSSIEAGALRSFDSDGNLRLVVGEQGDGTQTVTVVDGPTPPPPTRPSVAVDGPILTVVWDGGFSDDSTRPYDFARVEVVATRVGGTGAEIVGTIEKPEGGQATAAVRESGEYAVALVTVSQAGRRSVPSAEVVATVELVDLDGALKVVKESADGKNRLTWDPEAPPAAYDGAVGDTWFQTTDDGVAAQYTWTGAVWEAKPLTHEVISSIDLGKATVGELDGGRIEASTIGADQIAADAIDGTIITGATVQTARSGRRVVMSEQGISAFDDDGTEQVRVRAGDSFFRGDLEADRFTSRGQARFEGEATLAPGATLRLDGGVQAPVNPPQLTPHWPQFEAPLDTPGASNPVYAYGLAYAKGSFFTFLGEHSTADHNRVIQFDAFGNLQNEFKTKGTFWAQGGLAAVGGRLYLLGKYAPADYKYWVHVYTLDGKYVTEWEYEQVGWSKTNPLKYLPGIGSTDDGNLVIAQCTDEGWLIYRHYTTSGQIVLDERDETDRTRSHIAGAVSGVYDRLTNKPACTIAKTSNNTMPTFERGGWHLPDETFSAPPGETLAGLCVGPDDRFYSISNDGRVTQYMPAVTGGDDWWVSWAYTDSLTAPQYGTDVTDPVRVGSWPKRSSLSYTIDPDMMPQGAENITRYFRRSATKPKRQDMRFVSFLRLDVGEKWLFWAGTWEELDVGVPLRNDFPQTGNATLEAASKLFQVRSDGSGRWGNLSFSRDGTVSGLPAVPTIAYGDALMTSQRADDTSVMTVTLPAGRFSAPPTVVVSPATSVPYTTVRGVSAGDITKHSFNIYVNRRTSSNTLVNWIAVGD